MKNLWMKKVFQSIIFLTTIVIFPAMAIMPFEGIYEAPMDKTFNDFSFVSYRPILSLSSHEQQASVFKTLDYFSQNIPFSLEQIDGYFQHTFTKTIESPTVYPDDYTLTTTDKTLNIHDIDFRNREKGQMLIINLQQPVCFASDEFENIMKKQGFELDLNPPTAYFSKKMPNEQGQMSLGLADTEKELRCVHSLIFDTFPD